jgi:hypothetical protein
MCLSMNNMEAMSPLLSAITKIKLDLLQVSLVSEVKETHCQISTENKTGHFISKICKHTQNLGYMIGQTVISPVTTSCGL